MAAHTLTFTIPDLAEKGLTQQLTAENARRAAQEPPGAPLVDVDAYMVWVLSKIITDYREKFIAARAARIQDAVRATTPVNVATVLSTLGLNEEGL